MKKSTMELVLDLVDGMDDENANTVRDEITTELNRGKEKAAANRKTYEDTHDAIVGALGSTPVSVQELYDEIKEDLPTGFSRSKVQYALNHFWEDEVGIDRSGKSNLYFRK